MKDPYISPYEFQKIFLQIIDTFKKLHENRIFHKNINPSNIFVEPLNDVLRFIVADTGLETRKNMKLAELEKDLKDFTEKKLANDA